jgi:hypothetical protein
MRIVKENIDFKRGIGSKRALNLGEQGLINSFEKLLKHPKLEEIFLYNHNKSNSEVIDFIEIIFHDEIYNMEEEIADMGFDRFITIDLTNHEFGEDEDYELFLTTADIKPEYQELFGRIARKYGTRITVPPGTIMKSEPVPTYQLSPGAINEGVDFKRGISSKDAMHVGRDSIYRPPFNFDAFEEGLYTVVAEDDYGRGPVWFIKLKVEDNGSGDLIFYQMSKWSTKTDDIFMEPQIMDNEDLPRWVKDNDVVEFNYAGHWMQAETVAN